MRSDEYVLPESNVIDLPGLSRPIGQEPVPAEILANALDELNDKPKPKGRPKGAKNKKRKAKSAKSKPAVVPSAAATPGALTHPAVGSHAPGVSTRIAPSGEGIWDRVRRITPDGWLIIAAVVAMLALGTTLAVVIGGAKIW